MKTAPIVVTFVVLYAALAGRTNAAATLMPLPDFELTRLDGQVIRSSAEMPGDGKWLLIYVQRNCRPCDRLLNLVKQDEHPELVWRMVIINGGARAGATAMRDKRADIADAQWYADESRKAWTALRMTGAPVVFGVRDKTIQWSLSGMLKSDAEVKSVLSSWASE